MDCPFVGAKHVPDKMTCHVFVNLITDYSSTYLHILNNTACSLLIAIRDMITNVLTY